MFKKALVSVAVIAFVLGTVPSLASAETASSTPATQVAALLKQIQDLQSQIAELQKKQTDLRTEIKTTVSLIADLREGMTSDDVKALQEILAADPDVYPEGKVTGFYGPLTKLAVMKFQKKHGIEQVGNVGPKTRAKLNELLGDGEFACKAWGKLIAPGQMKKHVGGKIEIDLSKCANVPGGILKKIEGDWKPGKASTTASTTVDRKAPVIKDIDVDDVATSTAVISWETNEKAKGVLWYSTDSDVDLGDAEKESVSTLRTSHEVELEDLNDDTKYYFIVVSTDEAGNTATSSVTSFETDED